MEAQELILLQVGQVNQIYYYKEVVINKFNSKRKAKLIW